MQQPSRKRECRKLDQVYRKADDPDAPQRWNQDWSNDKFMRTVQLKTQFPVKAENFVDSARSPACPVKQTEQLREKRRKAKGGKEFRSKPKYVYAVELVQPAERHAHGGSNRRGGIEHTAAQPQSAVLLRPTEEDAEHERRSAAAGKEPI